MLATFLESANVPFKSATADFHQITETKVVGLQGVLMQDGRFIFMWIDGALRKMVSTQNNGTRITSGYLDKHVQDWVNESTWIRSHYETHNFQGIGSGRGSCLNLSAILKILDFILVLL